MNEVNSENTLIVPMRDKRGHTSVAVCLSVVTNFFDSLQLLVESFFFFLFVNQLPVSIQPLKGLPVKLIVEPKLLQITTLQNQKVLCYNSWERNQHESRLHPIDREQHRLEFYDCNEIRC